MNVDYLRARLITHARAIVLFAFALLALPYAFATPVFEKNDEVWHFAFVRHLAIGGGLPVQRPREDTAWLQIGSQPPLYYALAALVVRAFDLISRFGADDFDIERQPNQSPQYDPYWPGNKNMLLVTPQKRPFGYRGSSFAALILRVVGIIPGLVTVWFTWGIAQTVSGRRTVALIASGLTAFNPMLLTVTTAVSNDGLTIALSTAALYLLVQWMMVGAAPRRVLLTGTLIALAALAKVSGATLLPIALIASVAKPMLTGSAVDQAQGSDSLRPRSSAAIARTIVLVGLPFFLIAAWWFARNLALYGDPTGTNMMAAVAGTRHISLWQALGEFEGFHISYLAMFGQFNVPASDLVYRLWDACLVMSGAGLIIFFAGIFSKVIPAQRRALALIAGHIVLTLIAIVRWTMLTPASQGRLLFPCIAGVSTLMALGLDTLATTLARVVRRPAIQTTRPAVLWARAPVAFLPVALSFALAALSPFVYILPAYAPPLVSSLPEGFTPIKQTLSPWAEVLGVAMTPGEVHHGDKVSVKVFMRALKTPQFNWSLVTSLYGRDDAPLARFDTFTGDGLLPSSTWQPGQTWVDTVQLTVPPDARTPAILRPQFGLYNAGSGEIAPSADAHGNAASPLYDGSTLLPASSQIAPTTLVPTYLARFGDLAQLERGSVGIVSQTVTIQLAWQTRGQAGINYTVFLHLVDAMGKPVAQADTPPLDGQFPTTRWQAGVAFSERRTIPLPKGLRAGKYRVLIGMYDPITGARLTALDARGERAQDDAFKLSEVELGESQP